MLVISLDASGDIFIDGAGKAVIDHANVQRARLQTDSIKCLVGKYAPRTYGDKPAVDDANDPKQLTVRWERIERVIVDPDQHSAVRAEKPVEAPRQIVYQPAPPPADLSPEAWAAITRVSELIEQIAPSDETPEHVFGLIEGFLRSHFVASSAHLADLAETDGN